MRSLHAQSIVSDAVNNRNVVDDRHCATPNHGARTRVDDWTECCSNGPLNRPYLDPEIVRLAWVAWLRGCRERPLFAAGNTQN